MKKRHLLKKIQDTRNTVHRTMMPQSPSKWAPWDLTQFSQSLPVAPSYFPESHRQSEISSFSKVISVLGKARSHRAPNLGCRGAESPGWFGILSKNSVQDVMHEQAGTLLWWNCQSPVTHTCSLLNHPNSFHREMFKLNAKFDADSLLYSVSHFECNGHTVHMFTQWRLLPPLTSAVKLSLFTQAHSNPSSLASRLHWCRTNHSCYINNGWTFRVSSLFNFQKINVLSINKLLTSQKETTRYTPPGERKYQYLMSESIQASITKYHRLGGL